MHRSAITGKITAALLAAALLAMGIIHVQAENTGSGYRNDGEGSGFSITPLDPVADISNLNPGDQKTSRLELKNTGDHILTVYIRTQIDSESTPCGGHLADQMELTIQNGSSYLTQDRSFRAAAGDGSVLVGTMVPGSAKTLVFNVSLPGGTTDNRYQGSSIKAEWIFTTVYSDGGGGSGSSPGGGGYTSVPTSGIASSESSSKVSSSPSGSGITSSVNSQVSSVSRPSSESPSESAPDQTVNSPVTGERLMTLVWVLISAAGILAAGTVFIVFLNKIRHSQK